MPIFWNIFIKTISYFISIIFIVILIVLLLNFTKRSSEKFTFLNGNENSENIIAIIEISGMIIENYGFSNLRNPFIISPKDIKITLNNIEELSPEVIIFSINSPGGTVSASNNFYKIIKNFKQKTGAEVIFHTNELLASGAYWAAASGDGIFANYGSIIGSIGVKGPDWFFYDKPKSISSGLFSNKIETIEGIKVFSNKAGKSKDILNPFRKPEEYELAHLQNMVDEIYEDFVRIISKERKIEIDTLITEVGALIYSSNKAASLHLIDEVISLDDLINKIIIKRNFDNYKVIKKSSPKNFLLADIINSNLNQKINNIDFECLSLRSSLVAILNYQSTGC